MSLDVYLTMPGAKVAKGSSGIFVRAGGSTREITRDEWDAINPGVDPIMLKEQPATDEVYSANITHNLGPMANAAGIYEALWRPDKIGITHACQLIEPLTSGLERLRANPDEFKAYNPSNGWGSYDGLVRFVAGYLKACEQWPDAEVSVWR